MSTIVPVKVGNYTYLYESESYRDEKGNPQNNRKIIGKLDPKTKKPIYKPEFIKRITNTNEYPEILSEAMKTETEINFSISDIQGSTVKEYGLSYLFESISEEIGLKETWYKKRQICHIISL